MGNGRSMASRCIRPFPGLAAEARAGNLDRREFLAIATALGVTGPAAWGMLGLAAPARRAGTGRHAGGTIKIAQAVMRMDDPRIFDWSAERQPGAALLRAARAIRRRLHLPAVAAGELGSQRRCNRVHAEAPLRGEVEQRRRLQCRRRRLQPQPLVRAARPEQLDGDRGWPRSSRRRATRSSRAT